MKLAFGTILALLLLASCSSDPPEFSLSGQWSFDRERTLEHLRSARMPEGAKKIQQMAINAVNEKSVTWGPGTVEIKVGANSETSDFSTQPIEGSPGSWRIGIQPRREGSEKVDFTIEVTSDSSFTLSQVYDGVTFSEFYVKMP